MIVFIPTTDGTQGPEVDQLHRQKPKNKTATRLIQAGGYVFTSDRLLWTKRLEAKPQPVEAPVNILER